jgi:hypothetical protein
MSSKRKFLTGAKNNGLAINANPLNVHLAPEIERK